MMEAKERLEYCQAITDKLMILYREKKAADFEIELWDAINAALHEGLHAGTMSLI